jgi:hypothetical protein
MATNAITLETAWAFIAKALEANEPAGEIVIPSGKDTGLYVRVKPGLPIRSGRR